MKGTIELRNPILIDGAEVKSLTYDTEEITSEMYLKAMAGTMQKSGGVTGANIKLDAGAQLELGKYAVIAANPHYDITDLDRVKGSDIIQLQQVGQDFTLGREDQTEEPSAQQSDPTPKHTTRTSSDSDK